MCYMPAILSVCRRMQLSLLCCSIQLSLTRSGTHGQLTLLRIHVSNESASGTSVPHFSRSSTQQVRSLLEPANCSRLRQEWRSRLRSRLPSQVVVDVDVSIWLA